MGSAPVRIGNGAATQLQLDIYGELMDSVYLCNKYGLPIYHDGWMRADPHPRVADRPLGPARRGHLGDARRPPRLHVLAADELGRGRARDPDRPPARAARRHSPAGWRSATAIYNQIMEHGWNADRRAFVQHYDTDVLDASLLLMPLCQVHRTHRPALDLHARRHQPRSWSPTASSTATTSEASPDGLAGDEATFSLCSFWWVEALARAGRLDEARLAFEKMLTYANHVGLYSEEIGPHRRAARQLPPGLHAPGADQRRLQPRPPARVIAAWPSHRRHPRR